MNILVGQSDTLVCSSQQMLNFVIRARVTLLKYFLNFLVLSSLERIAPLKWLTYELAVN